LNYYSLLKNKVCKRLFKEKKEKEIKTTYFALKNEEYNMSKFYWTEKQSQDATKFHWMKIILKFMLHLTIKELNCIILFFI